MLSIFFDYLLIAVIMFAAIFFVVILILFVMEWYGFHSGWGNIDNELNKRRSILLKSANLIKDELIKGNIPEKEAHDRALTLAATDVFVEKAQKRITKRAKLFFVLGFLSVAFFVLILWIPTYYMLHMTVPQMIGIDQADGLYVLFKKDTSDFLSQSPAAPVVAPPEAIDSLAKVNGYVFGLVVLKSIAIAGLVAALAYFLASLGKSFFHEGIVLMNRRHSMRFGRLMMYIYKGDMTNEKVDEVFKWNYDFDTSFRSLDVKALSGTFWGKLAEVVKSSIDKPKEMLSSAVSAVVKKEDDKNEKKDG